MKKITVVIPCYNEEKGIGKVIKGIPKEKLKEYGFDFEVVVIDNNCSDKTSSVARKLGAKIICEPNPGKGNAIRTGFRSIGKDTDYVVMLDGDDTYKSYEIMRMVEPLDSGFCDVIIGSRLEGRMNGYSMSFSHRFANWFFTFITRNFYGANVTDTCTGYFAWKREAIVNLNGYLKSPGFAIEAEMITKMAKLGQRVYSVPITYDPRAGDSKLSPVMDGIKITSMLIKNIWWNPKQAGRV
ncbi:glycosyltransferase family 2 protein [Patescibacteria group bacterium]|nr:glycosyltransferase family 2 protein [Patescibacteria group bacterium]